MDWSDRRISTGLPFLDRRLDGGLVAGCLLAIVSPPHSQGELFLRHLVLERPTVYVSLTRPAPEVRTWASEGGAPVPDLTVLTPEPEDLFGETTPIGEALVQGSFVIVDRANALETADRSEYLAFLDGLKGAVEETDSVGVLHCSQHRRAPPRRGLTLDRVDQVWQLELLPLSREIKNRLLVTKARRGRALQEPIDVLLTDRVQVDTSRRIG